MLIVGNLEDQLSILVYSKISDAMLQTSPYKEYLSPLLSPLTASEPIAFFIFGLFRNPYWYNVLIVATILLNLYFSAKYFSGLRYKWVYTLLFCFQTYFWLHVGPHLALSQLWLYPMFLMSHRANKSPLVLGGLLVFSVLLSNYIGFFLLLYYFLHSFLNGIITKNWGVIKKWLVTNVIVLLSLLFFLYPYFNSIYFRSPTEQRPPYSRNLEDFFYFSSRPWNLLIPSPKSLLYGSMSKQLITRLDESNNLITKNYFAGEHPANFFGYAFGILFIIILFRREPYAPTGKNGIKEFLNSFNLTKSGGFLSLLLLLLLFLFMQPPHFTIAGILFYTPSYLMAKFFVMFRCTVRLSALIFLLLLTFASQHENFVTSFLKKYFGKASGIIVFSFTVFSLVELLVPVKLSNLVSAPPIFQYMRQYVSGSRFVVYPYSKNTEALFWVDVHKGYLVNIRNFFDSDFDTEKYTRKLTSSEGLLKLPNDNISYILVNFEDPTVEKFHIFFDTSPTLKLLTSQGLYSLYEVNKPLSVN